MEILIFFPISDKLSSNIVTTFLKITSSFQVEMSQRRKSTFEDEQI